MARLRFRKQVMRVRVMEAAPYHYQPNGIAREPSPNMSRGRGLKHPCSSALTHLKNFRQVMNLRGVTKHDHSPPRHKCMMMSQRGVHIYIYIYIYIYLHIYVNTYIYIGFRSRVGGALSESSSLRQACSNHMSRRWNVRRGNQFPRENSISP